MKKTLSTCMTQIMLIVLIAVSVVGCSSPATPTAVQPVAATNAPAEPTATTVAAEPTAPVVATDVPAKATDAPAVTYHEAPVLADQVKAGKLPPVDERLPVNPLVISAQ